MLFGGIYYKFFIIWPIAVPNAPKYLFAAKALSKVFRAKYLSGLRAGGVEDKALIDSLFKIDWVVYAKRPFGGPKQVIEYLGRYTHKVAISNHRIRHVSEQVTTFTYKNYKEGGKQKEMTLSNEEFTRRYTMHILPYRFVRIRHYGILSSSWKRAKLPKLQEYLGISSPKPEVKTLLWKCPCCKIGTLITIAILPKRGPPQGRIRMTLNIPVA